MTLFRLKLEREGRAYDASYAFTEGAVRLRSAFGSASGPATADPHQAAEDRFHRVLDAFERSPPRPDPACRS